MVYRLLSVSATLLTFITANNNPVIDQLLTSFEDLLVGYLRVEQSYSTKGLQRIKRRFRSPEVGGAALRSGDERWQSRWRCEQVASTNQRPACLGLTPKGHRRAWLGSLRRFRVEWASSEPTTWWLRTKSQQESEPWTTADDSRRWNRKRRRRFIFWTWGSCAFIHWNK